MKFDLDAARYVLLEMEKQPYGEALKFDDLAARSKKFSEPALQYACVKLKEAGLIRAFSVGAWGEDLPIVIDLLDITFSGHEFLNNVRSPKMWKDIKSAARKLGSNSLETIIKVAPALIQAAISAGNF